MADNDSEKTEYLSQKRLEESREKGELPRSQELNTFVVFALFLLFFGMTRLAWFESLGAIMTDMLQFDRHMNITTENVGELLIGPAFKAVLVLAPLFGLILVVSPLLSMAQTGFNIATDKLEANWGRLNPLSGLQRMISMHQWVEGFKSCIKIGIFAWLAWGALKKAMPSIQMMGGQDLRGQIGLMLDVSMAIGIRIAVLMAVLAIFDFGYQWWEFQKKLRMTPQEMKDEMKERDGNPLIKSRQRSIAMKRHRDQMMNQVPKASVIVTNPTHYAVALSYDRNKAPAPFVCAKGTQFMALRIRELAKQHNIPIIENRPLARALYKHVKVGHVIPSEFFKAVAEVLAFVFMLKQRRKSGMGMGMGQPAQLSAHRYRLM